MLTPTEHRVIVKPDETEGTTKGGLIIPDTVRDQQRVAMTAGHIIAVGPSAEMRLDKEEPCRRIDIGDYVIYVKYGGAEVTHNGEKLRLLNDDDVIALVTDIDKEKE